MLLHTLLRMQLSRWWKLLKQQIWSAASSQPSARVRAGNRVTARDAAGTMATSTASAASSMAMAATAAAPPMAQKASCPDALIYCASTCNLYICSGVESIIFIFTWFSF
jgi:hypothetical protein